MKIFQPWKFFGSEFQNCQVAILIHNSKGEIVFSKSCLAMIPNFHPLLAIVAKPKTFLNILFKNNRVWYFSVKHLVEKFFNQKILLSVFTGNILCLS